MNPKIVALFPGQGSQQVGMGKNLYDNFKTAREVFEEASDAAHLNLRKLCFEGPESDLNLTENTQPCLLTASIAAFRVAQTELGFHPAAAAGHSLGEYGALIAAGTLPLSSAVHWVHERGIAMQSAVPVGQGSMAAVMGLEDAAVVNLCLQATGLAQEKREKGENKEMTIPAIVEPANYNAPGQIVISGSVDALQEAITLVKAAGGKAIPLAVSAPFHSRLMAPVRHCLSELFAIPKQRPGALDCPYIPNRTGRITGESGVVFEFLVEQVDHPVLWKQSMTALLDQGFTQFIEFGPGKVLQGLLKRIAPKDLAYKMLGVSDSDSLKILDEQIKGTAQP